MCGGSDLSLLQRLHKDNAYLTRVQLTTDLAPPTWAPGAAAQLLYTSIEKHEHMLLGILLGHWCKPAQHWSY